MLYTITIPSFFKKINTKTKPGRFGKAATRLLFFCIKIKPLAGREPIKNGQLQKAGTKPQLKINYYFLKNRRLHFSNKLE